MTDISRRKLLTASAWAVPVVAVTVATPLVAASNHGIYGLEIVSRYPPVGDTTDVDPGEVLIIVTLPGSALPIMPGSTSLTIEYQQGAGFIDSATLPNQWTAAQDTELLNVSYAGQAPELTSEFTFNIPNYSRWRVVLEWPEGSITQHLEILPV